MTTLHTDTEPNNPKEQKQVSVLPLDCDNYFSDNFLLLHLRIRYRNMAETQVGSKESFELLIPEISKFIDHISLERRLSSHTSRNYYHALKSFFQWASIEHGKVVSPEEICKNDCRSYIIESQKKNTPKQP